MNPGGFAYRDGVLFAEDVAIPDLAERIGTPFYCYSTAGLRNAYREFAGAVDGLGADICYAVKANGNQAVVSLFAALGAGADVVSEGELRRALAAGVDPARIVFSGVGKTRSEIAAALEAGCGQLNVESAAELEAVSEVASGAGRRAAVAIRVNPDVDARTHRKISTGRAGDKFGIALELVPDAYRRAGVLPGVDPVGLAVHIGSQLTDLEPFRDAFLRLAGLVRRLRGEGCPVARLDLGGGLGVAYRNESPPSAADYAGLIREIFGGLDLSLALEPGRRLTADAGILVSRVIYMKESGGRRFAIVDAAMNDLLRPALYDAWHGIDPVRPSGPDATVVDVVGPVCESGDALAVQRELPPLAAGDLLAVRSAGAYGAVMSSAYNARPPAPEAMVNGDAHAVIRPRTEYDTMVGQDRVPDWIAGGTA